MVAPVLGGVVVQLVGTQSFSKLGVRQIGSTLEGVEREISRACPGNVVVGGREPAPPRLLKVFPRCVVKQADKPAFLIGGNQFST